MTVIVGATFWGGAGLWEDVTACGDGLTVPPPQPTTNRNRKIQQSESAAEKEQEDDFSVRTRATVAVFTFTAQFYRYKLHFGRKSTIMNVFSSLFSRAGHSPEFCKLDCRFGDECPLGSLRRRECLGRELSLPVKAASICCRRTLKLRIRAICCSSAACSHQGAARKPEPKTLRIARSFKCRHARRFEFRNALFARGSGIRMWDRCRQFALQPLAQNHFVCAPRVADATSEGQRELRSSPADALNAKRHSHGSNLADSTKPILIA